LKVKFFSGEIFWARPQVQGQVIKITNCRVISSLFAELPTIVFPLGTDNQATRHPDTFPYTCGPAKLNKAVKKTALKI
jgi:hypothetical protein